MPEETWRGNATGNYTTARRGGISYNYELSWTVSQGQLSWTATVRPAEGDALTVSETVPFLPAIKPETLARIRVEFAMEHLG